jgi:hypothetical protein
LKIPKEEEVKYNLLGQEISKIKDEKNIGVLIDDELSFDKHICEMVSKANSIFAALLHPLLVFYAYSYVYIFPGGISEDICHSYFLI